MTGSAGFIGSHLLEHLLRLEQDVVSIDNFATGYRRNLDEVRAAVGEHAWKRHTFIEGDIVDLDACARACRRVDVVLHQAALGSVPRSIEQPLATHAANATGFLNVLVAARDAGVKRFVYAASSSTYGDHPGLPKVEDEIGMPLSPYAVTKYVDELYARVFDRCYGIATVGLRYFNVFGPRQDPDGAYAAVIPRWAAAMLTGSQVTINGDGETTRDFCYVANVVQANLRAATSDAKDATNPFASPLRAESHRGLPPAFVITGEKDPLRDEGEDYVAKLRQAGVSANGYRMQGASHLGPLWARAAPAAVEALDLPIGVLRAAFRSGK